MNKAQKILTVVCLVAVVATLICFPWHCKKFVGDHYEETIEYGFVLSPPLPWATPLWSGALFTWAALGVIYPGLFFVLKKKSKVSPPKGTALN